MADTMIKVNGVTVKTPSSFTYGLQTISASDAGRTQDTIMHVNKVGEKVKLELSWNGLTWAETAAIMRAFSSTYFMVTYPDMKTGTYQTKQFYHGDMSAPVKWWFNTAGKKIIDNLSFNIIEV